MGRVNEYRHISYPHEPEPHQRRLVEALGFEVVVDEDAPASCPVCAASPLYANGLKAPSLRSLKASRAGAQESV